MYNGMEESTEVKKSLTSLGESRRIISTDQPTEYDGGRGLSPDCSPVAGGALVADGIIARISMDKEEKMEEEIADAPADAPVDGTSGGNNEDAGLIQGLMEEKVALQNELLKYKTLMAMIRGHVEAMLCAADSVMPGAAGGIQDPEDQDPQDIPLDIGRQVVGGLVETENLQRDTASEDEGLSPESSSPGRCLQPASPLGSRGLDRDADSWSSV